MEEFLSRMGKFFVGGRGEEEFSTAIKEKKEEEKVEKGGVARRGIGKIQDLQKAEGKKVLKIRLKPMIIVLVGKPEAGKTTDLRSILLSYNQERYFEGGVYWTSGTGKMNPDLDCLDPKMYIEATEKAVYEHIERLQEEYEKAMKKGKELAPNALIIEDGTGWLGHHKPTGNKKDMVKILATTYRHLNCTLIHVGHTATATMPAIRTSSNMTIAHQSNMEDHWIRIKKDFGMCLPERYKKKKEFLELVSQECVGSKGLIFRSSRMKNDVHIFESHNVEKGKFKMHKARRPVIPEMKRE
jgi:hypothetical protein